MMDHWHDTGGLGKGKKVHTKHFSGSKGFFQIFFSPFIDLNPLYTKKMF